MGTSHLLSAEKQALLKLRLKGGGRASDTLRVPRRDGTGPAPLSFAQFYIWAADRKTPGNPSHNLPVGFRIKGALDAALLERAFNEVARRHESLRTSFEIQDGEPVQVVHSECPIRIAVVDLAHLAAAEREIRLRQLASSESVRPFDLSRAPLARLSLFRLGEADHVMIINLHHIIADGLSFAPLLRELDEFYSALGSGSTPNLPDLAVQYADFAAWLRSELARGSYRGQADYWRGEMSRPARPLALPFDRARPETRAFRGANVYFSIPRPLVEKLVELDREGASFFSVVLALFRSCCTATATRRM
jgi:hypothetical protein